MSDYSNIVGALAGKPRQPNVSTANIVAALRNMPVERGSMFPLTTYADGSTRYDPNNGSIIGDVIRAVTFPGRALQGQVQPQGMADEAANFGLSVGLGSIAGVRPRGSIGAGGRPAALIPKSVDGLGYYSQALEAAKGWGQSKGTPEQALMWLKKSGVKDAEIEATGLRSVLEGRPSITRDEIVRHLEVNRVGLNEVKYGGKSGVMGKDPKQIGTSGPGRFPEYSLDPSNPTYRETVLHLPTEAPKGAGVIRSNGEVAQEMFGRSFAQLNDVERQSVLNRQQENIQARQTEFYSGHFPEPNIVGHMMTSMTKHEGRPVYTVDQIQSDWGQRLRDGGVYDQQKVEALRRELNKYGSETDGPAWQKSDQFLSEIGEAKPGNLTRDEVLDLLDRVSRNKAYDDHSVDVQNKAAQLWDEMNVEISERRRIEAEIATAESATPGHPLVNTTDQWTNTTLRRALRQAAEADAEYIAIPSGDTVLSYNPGDTHGMNTFYNEIVPKNLAGILKKYGYKGRGDYVPALETPSKGMAGSGFTLFPLAPDVREGIKQGMPLFANAPTSALLGLISRYYGGNEGFGK